MVSNSFSPPSKCWRCTRALSGHVCSTSRSTSKVGAVKSVRLVTFPSLTDCFQSLTVRCSLVLFFTVMFIVTVLRNFSTAYISSRSPTLPTTPHHDFLLIHSFSVHLTNAWRNRVCFSSLSLVKSGTLPYTGFPHSQDSNLRGKYQGTLKTILTLPFFLFYFFTEPFPKFILYPLARFLFIEINK